MQKTFRAMAPYGRVVTLMGAPGDDTDLTAYNLNLTLHNVMMLTPMWKGLETSACGPRPASCERCSTLVADGKLTIRHADRPSHLADAAEAHALLESGKASPAK